MGRQGGVNYGELCGDLWEEAELWRQKGDGHMEGEGAGFTRKGQAPPDRGGRSSWEAASLWPVLTSLPRYPHRWNNQAMTQIWTRMQI